jgi:hypothetical protein
MRFSISMPKVACSLLFLPAILLVAAIAGCGGPDASSPEVKKKIQENAAVIKDADEADSVRAKPGTGKKAVMKSIKGRLGGGD